MSTPRFFRCLTDLSRKISLMTDSIEQKRTTLIIELKRMNQHLPASVYVPFVSQSLRNYAVLHIPVSEVKIF
jgi:mRNA-degrading endonuclease toxin of MazEF toxin-antitoxin module